MRFRAILPLLLLPLASPGCGADRGDSAREEAVSYTDVAPGAGAAPATGADAIGAGGAAERVEQGRPGSEPRPAPPPGAVAAADTAGAAPATAPGGAPAIPAMIIRTGRATVQVDSLEAAVERVRRLAAQLGGYVGATTVQTGRNEVRTATLELKVPSARFDQAVGGLRPLGKVESVQVQAEDVGEEFVDVTARVANARRLEERLIDLLARRTGRLEDVLAVERELARVREEIERYEGRLRYLRTRVAVSTLTVMLHEPYPVVGDYPGQNPVARAFRDAWRNFVGFVAGFISSLGVLIPLGLLIAAGVWIVRRLWPKRPFRPAPSADEPKPGPEPPARGPDY